jgi:hypothetical protein
VTDTDAEPDAEPDADGDCGMDTVSPKPSHDADSRLCQCWYGETEVAAAGLVRDEVSLTAAEASSRPVPVSDAP